MALTQVDGGLLSPTNGQFYGMKSRIINGAMVIDQRNAGAAVTANGSFPVDRFKINNTTDGTFSAQQSSTVPSSGGFVNSVLVTVTSADTSLTTTQRLALQQSIEGFNTADLAWGTANAKTVTLSFWVQSSLTGTFSGSLRNSAGDRSYPYTYTISAANTWEQKSVTIAGDTSGTWLTTNSEGIILFFSLGVGPSLLGTAGAWASAGYWGATGETPLVGTNGATFYITGVQLEKGSTATSFDYRPYGTELALCQRYFQQFGGTVTYEYIGDAVALSTTGAYAGISLLVPMRTAPSFAFTGAANNFTLDGGNNNYRITSNLVINSGTSTQKARLSVSYSAGTITTSQYYTLLTYSTSTGKLQFSAEL